MRRCEPRSSASPTSSYVIRTSESTVVRLCQKIGYKGYQEFKIMLARDLVGPTETVYEQIDPKDSLETLKAKVFQANAQALKDTIEVLSDDELKRAVDAIAGCRKIEVYGIGGGGRPWVRVS